MISVNKAYCEKLNKRIDEIDFENDCELEEYLVSGIDTSKYKAGEVLYIGENGSLTNQKPVEYIYEVDNNESLETIGNRLVEQMSEIRNGNI